MVVKEGFLLDGVHVPGNELAIDQRDELAVAILAYVTDPSTIGRDRASMGAQLAAYAILRE
jgi:hypothetical protein